MATPIHSDSEDTLVLWFPDRGVCANNHLWPALFNIFAMRGETYRDPLVRLEAFDLMLEGELSLDRFRAHHPSAGRVLAAPARADFERSVCWRFTDSGTAASLRVRHGVAVPAGDDPAADIRLTLDLRTWAALYAGDTTASAAEAAGTLTISGDRRRLAEFFGAFDRPALVRTFTE